MALALTLTSCRPKGILTSREMRDLLYDLHRADGILQEAGYNYGHQQDLSGYYHNVLEAHGVTKAEFDSSLVWYTDHPQLFDKMYPKVIARLQADVDALSDKEGLREQKEAELRDAEPRRTMDELMEFYRDGFINPWHVWTPDTVPAEQLLSRFIVLSTDTIQQTDSSLYRSHLLNGH